MIDYGMKNAVMRLANVSGLRSIHYYDTHRNKLPTKKATFDFALLTFNNGERFEVSSATLKLIPTEQLKITRGNNETSSKVQQRGILEKAKKGVEIHDGKSLSSSRSNVAARKIGQAKRAGKIQRNTVETIEVSGPKKG